LRRNIQLVFPRRESILQLRQKCLSLVGRNDRQNSSDLFGEVFPSDPLRLIGIVNLKKAKAVRQRPDAIDCFVCSAITQSPSARVSLLYKAQPGGGHL